MISVYGKKRKLGDLLLYGLIYGSAGIAIMILLYIIGYVFIKGMKVIDLTFLTTVTSVLKGTVGILGNIVNTIYIVVLTLLIATPIGVGSAIYLNEYAKPGKIVSVIEFTTETLAGIPSIIYGLFGMVFFGTTLGLKTSVLTGSFTLAIMVLPLITRNTQEALKTVPQSYRSGALGMGATKWYMIRTVLLPSAMPGILTGILLSIGRIVGESAALLFTAGSGRALPKSGIAGFFRKFTESSGTLTIEMYLQMQDGKYDIAFGIGCVLLVTVFCINLLAKFLASKFDVTKKQ